jgi:tetratricopeptide (TPR) repeat protein
LPRQPYVFVPYESSSLADKKSYLNEKDTEEIKKKIGEVQKIIDEFDSQTDIKDKNNAYFVLASHQQSIGLYLDAKKTLETSLKENINTNIIQSYAILLHNMGAKKAALQYIDNALKIAPQIPSYWRSKIDLANDVYGADQNYMDDLYTQALKSTGDNIDIVTVYAQFL